jgi:hypothetical protein
VVVSTVSYGKAPRFVTCQQIGGCTSARFNLEIEIAERLTVRVTDDEAGVGFFNGPRQRGECADSFRRRIPP